MEKAVFIMKGLTCSNCAGKIETGMCKLKNVSEAEINLLKQEMTVSYEGDKKEVLESAKKITAKYEADVVVSEKEEKRKSGEKVVSQHAHHEGGCCGHHHEHNHDHCQCNHHHESNESTSQKAIIVMKGLTCSNCAGKIEADMNKLENVSLAEINLLKQEMTVAYTGEKNSVLASAKKITQKYEPDVLVYEQLAQGSKDNIQKEKNSGAKEDSDEKGGYKKLIIQFSSGIGFFLAALIIKEPKELNIALYMISYFILGGEVLLRAVKNILRGQVFDENFLMALSTVGAIAIGEMPEAVFVMLFYQVGETFQDFAVEKSRKSIKALMGIRPDYANVVRGNDIIQIDPEEVSVGDIIVIKPGEKVPLDGIVLEGKSTVDTSALTGESVPRGVNVGDEVLSGGINVSGVLNIRVTKDFSESTVVKILEMTENAASKKTKTEQFITKFARVYTPAVVIAAVILAFVPQLFTPEADLIKWISRSLVFLVVSCPCALVLSVPLGFFSGIGEGSKNGVLFKGSNYLQALCDVDTAVFDKTGTITEGVFTVSQVSPVGITEKELLKITAYTEKLSNHPIAKSIAEVFEKEEEIEIEKIKNYEEISGHGVSAEIEGKKIYAGNGRLMDKIGVKYHKHIGMGSVVYVATEEAFLGKVVVSDRIKKDSKEAIKKLKAAGIKEIIMLTGDNKDSAEAVGKEVGVDRVESQLLPGDKVKKVEEIYKRSENAKLLFVGDGINDAPVLSRVEVGIAMGGVGSDAAIEAADVVIMNDSLLKITDAITIAKNTNKIVRQNIVFALGVKGVVLVMGAVGIAGMWLAVFADVGVAVIAILNSMRKKI